MTSADDEPTAERLRKQINRLLFAETDMKAAAAGASMMPTVREDEHPYLSHCLLTGIIASYARPFTDNDEIGALPEKYRPKAGTPDGALHDILLKRRHKFAAHTDPSAQYRLTEDMLGVGAYVEPLQPYLADGPAVQIVDLCLRQAQRFAADAAALEQMLRDRSGKLTTRDDP